MINNEKEEIIEEIQHLISIDGTSVDINPNYLEYFELEELIEIKETLLDNKINHSHISNDFLDELYHKCSK